MPRAGRFSGWAGQEVQKRGYLEQSAYIGSTTEEMERPPSDLEVPQMELPPPGTGEYYRVCFQGRIPVRERPCEDAPVLDVLKPKMCMELFTWSGSWRSVVRGLARNKGAPSLGWVLVKSESLGSLMELIPEREERRNGDDEEPALEIKRGWLSLKDRQQLDNGALPLAMAARKRDINKVIQLLWRGHDPNATDMLGETALFEIAGSDAHELVLVLLLAMANPVHEAKSGLTPVAMSEASRHHELLVAFAARLGKAAEQPKMTPALKDALFGLPIELESAARRHLGLMVDYVGDKKAPAEVSNQESQAAQPTTSEQGPQVFDIAASDEDQEVCRGCGSPCDAAYRFCAYCGFDMLEQRAGSTAPVTTGLDEEAQEADQALGLRYRVVFRGRLPVRLAPTKDGEVVAILKPGEEVLVTDGHDSDDSAWRKVRTWGSDRGYCDGWVLTHSATHGKLIEKIAQD